MNWTTIIAACVLAVPLALLAWLEATGGYISDKSMIPGCLVVCAVALTLIALASGSLVVGCR